MVRLSAYPLTPSLSPECGGEGAGTLPLPLAGEGRGEGVCALVLKSACAIALIATAAAAGAHDTWFHPLSARGGAALMSLGTGNRFPLQEFPVGTEHLRQSGCRSADQRPVAMTAVRNTPKALLLRAVVKDAAMSGEVLPAPVTCWAQLVPFDIELPSPTVEIYLAEINAPPAVRDAWAEMRSRGVTWKERYTKHARIELRGGPVQGATPLAPAPSGMAMDILLESGLQSIRPADPLVFQVLREGQPLPGLAVELVGDQGRSAGWHTTDAQGRVRMPAPDVGRWVLRGTDLRVSDAERDSWESRFVTLAFEVVGPPTDAR